MELESYQIPESYLSYLETFQSDPDHAIQRLKTRIEKRNSGAIGYFFLAWLYFKNNDREKALEAAWQAKVRAPGSRFMERLHYYIAHPHAFDAWEPKKTRKEFKREVHHYDQSHPIEDLDSLITKLSSVERTRLKPDLSDQALKDLSENSSDVDDIVTETLAVIHEKQENLDAAIKTYRRLIKANPDKEEHFQHQIERLQQKLSDDKKEL
jgi:tetratricopeptide (TPR) repeat protein